MEINKELQEKIERRKEELNKRGWSVYRIQQFEQDIDPYAEQCQQLYEALKEILKNEGLTDVGLFESSVKAVADFETFLKS